VRVNVTTRSLSARYEERLAERTRIARELHDTVLQNLAGASLQLALVTKSVAVTSPDSTQSIDRIRRQLDSAHREARRKVWDLRSPLLEEHDLPEALRRSVRTMSTIAETCSVSVDITGEPRNVTSGVEEHLLRIAEESLANALRHSNASRITVSLQCDPTCIRLCVVDDGDGFDVDRVEHSPGHCGLRSIRERADEICADLTITSEYRLGTRIDVAVAVRDAAEAAV
jgi:signal transduction histidine kinase